MSGVIVVDAESFRSTCLRRDAYIHDHCFGYRHDYSLFYQLPNSNLFTHHILCSREKPLMKNMPPGISLLYIKIQKYLAAILFTLFHFVFFLYNLSITTRFDPCN